MTKDEALKLALEALEYLPEMRGIEETITAIKEALAQPVQSEFCQTCAEIHLLLDADKSMIKNAQDGYPEGRTPQELTLPERVKALCKYAADWKRWCIEAEALAQSVQHREGHWCADLTCSRCYSADFRFKHTHPPLPVQPVQPVHKHDAAIKTLEHLKYTYHGGEYWKPPLGKVKALAQPEERVTKITWDARGVRTVDGVPDDAPQRTWVGLMRGVRVEGNAVVITVKGGNDEARALCGELINEMEKNT